jgi:hypothetical protein
MLSYENSLGGKAMINSTRNFCAAFLVVMGLWSIPTARAAEQNRTYLIERFQDGDIPTGQDFKDLIDSALNLVDDGLTSYRIGVDSSGSALRLIEGQTVGPSLAFAPKADNPPLAPLWAGQFGFLPMEFQDASLNSHYGYFQLQMDAGPLPPPPGSPGPAIFVEYLVWETDANVPVTTSVVPEPMSATLLCGGFVLLCRSRRKRIAL